MIIKKKLLSQEKVAKFKSELEKQVKTQQEQREQQLNITLYKDCTFSTDSSVSSQTTTITYYIYYDQQLVNRELAKLEQDYQALESTNQFSSDLQKINKTALFLGAKQIFATNRQNTIKQLIIVGQKLAKSDKRYNLAITAGNYLGNVRELVSIFPGGGIAVDIISKGVPVIANLLKSCSSAEYKQEFEGYLIEDEKAISLLEKTHLTLDNSLQGNEKSDINSFIRKVLNLDAGKFDQYNIFTVSKLQKGEELTPEKMKSALELLTENLHAFVDKSRQEVKDCTEEMEKLFKGKDGERLQTEVITLLEKLTGKESKDEQVITEPVSLENQIQLKEIELEQLKNSVKGRLESRTSAIPIIGGIRNGK
jgi:hypothetical protein